MKTTPLRTRALCASALMILLAGCTTADRFAGRPAASRHLSQVGGYRRVALPTVAIVITCTDGEMTAAETNEVLAFMTNYFGRQEKVVIDNPLRADYIAHVVVARNGALKVSDWTLVSATYRKNKLGGDTYAATWGDDFNWRRACASFRFGGGYGYGYSGFGYDDFYPYGFGSGGNCYYTPTPVYTTPHTRPVCPTLPTYCANPPIHHPRPVTCPPSPYCPRPRPDDTSVVQTRPSERPWPTERLVYVGNVSHNPFQGGGSNYNANGQNGGSYGGGSTRAASRVYDSPQPIFPDRSANSYSEPLTYNGGGNSQRYDSPAPSYTPPASSSSSDLHMASAPTQSYSSPEPSYSRAEPSPTYSAPSPSYSAPSAPAPEPVLHTQTVAN